MICCSVGMNLFIFPNYFITVVYYYCIQTILFLYFFSIPTFLHFKIFFITDYNRRLAYNVAYVRGMRGIFQNGGRFGNIQTLIFALLIRPYNCLS